jgi:hypothetical protein
MPETTGLVSLYHHGHAGLRLPDRYSSHDAAAGCRKKESAAALLIQLAVPEVRHLLYSLLWLVKPAVERVLAWSRWRRAHQLAAKHAHIPRQQRLFAQLRALR